MSRGKAQFTGRKQVTMVSKRDDESPQDKMLVFSEKGAAWVSERPPDKLLLFSEKGPAWVFVADIDARVQSLLQQYIPTLFDGAGVEHEDHAGIIAEIQGAVWVAARTVADCKLMNSAADTSKELEVIGRGGWICELEAHLNTQNFDAVSDEAWWEVVKLKARTLDPLKPLALTVEEFDLLAAAAAKKGRPGKVRDSDAVSEAATQLTMGVIKALGGNESALKFSLASYSARQKRPSPAVNLLHDLGAIAGLSLEHGTWRNKLAEARKG